MMDCTFFTLLVLAILETVLFQQVFVNLLQDLANLQLCQHSICDISNPIKTSAYYFLSFCSTINILLHITNISFHYIVRRRQQNGRKKPFSFYCLDITLTRDMVMVWSVFKTIFSLFLFLSLLHKGSLSLPVGGSLTGILIFSTGR